MSPGFVIQNIEFETKANIVKLETMFQWQGLTALKSCIDTETS